MVDQDVKCLTRRFFMFFFNDAIHSAPIENACPVARHSQGVLLQETTLDESNKAVGLYLL